MSTVLRLGVLASGRGSNFLSLINAIKDGQLNAEMKVLISNKKKAGALNIAQENQIPDVFISMKTFPEPYEFDQQVLDTFKKFDVNFVVLAGYLKLLSKELVQTYKNRILNIHPALLPSFGGKGMYGHHVHESVINRGCKVSGVTVHLVDELYDHGPIVMQKCVPVLENDDPDLLAARVLVQEHKVFAEALQLFAEERVQINGQRAVILPKS
jgi:phosphoribosylglycinamide formyltransferase 1